MKAVLLAAGLGTRLRPITNKVPKCMVPVNGMPIIEKQILNLVENGIKDIYVVAGYKCEVLKAFSAKNRHKAQRKAKFYINKCRSASCMQGGLKQASA